METYKIVIDFMEQRIVGFTLCFFCQFVVGAADNRAEDVKRSQVELCTLD